MRVVKSLGSAGRAIWIFRTNCIHSDLSQKIPLLAFCVRSEMLA